jgi:hypothetical protein
MALCPKQVQHAAQNRVMHNAVSNRFLKPCHPLLRQGTYQRFSINNAVINVTRFGLVKPKLWSFYVSAIKSPMQRGPLSQQGMTNWFDLVLVMEVQF